MRKPGAPLTGAKQSMASWANAIESRAEVPEVYRSLVDSLIGEERALPYMVLAPPVVGAARGDADTLLFETDGVLYVVARAADRLTPTGYPLAHLRDVEVGNILLYAWFAVSGVTTEETLHTSAIEFNTATRDRFDPLLTRIRSALGEGTAPVLNAEQDCLDALAEDNFKFANYARESLVEHENVIDLVWQPEIRESFVPWLRLPFSRTVTTAHLVLLTDRELILIREDERSRRNRGVRYGGVWRYIPLRSVASASVTVDEALVTLSIRLAPEGSISRHFALDKRDEVERVRTAIESAIAEQPSG